MWAQAQQFGNPFDGSRRVEERIPGDGIAGSRLHVCRGQRQTLHSDKVIKTYAGFGNLLNHFAWPVGVAHESVWHDRRELTSAFKVGQQRQEVRVLLVEPLLEDSVEPWRPP